ncbi:MAG: thiamine phosphate synthase [bacterium]
MKATDKLSGLYGITDGSQGDVLFSKVQQAIRGGLRILQYRDKSQDHDRRLQEALHLRELCCQNNVLFIINDDIVLAQRVFADGVHLGQNDRTIQQARLLLGADTIIGVSCYNQLALAQTAEKSGADYVAFGACFPSKTKPQAPVVELSTLHAAKQQLRIPVCAIGGITLDNAAQLVKQQIDMLAVIQGLFASEAIAQRAQHFQQLFQPVKYH